MENTQLQTYHVHYGPAQGWSRVDLRELWRYKDLSWLFVKRDFNVMYKQTVLGPAWILINPLMSTAMYCVMFGTIAQLTTDGVPQILIYHTQSQETFADSRPGERAATVIGLGDDLQELLEKQYGYEVLHITEAFDMKEGCLERSRAYNYAEPVIAAALEEHPSIQVVIDLHRDGVNGSKRLETEINGMPTAQIMFFNGLSRTKESGELTSLPNPYQAENLAFSFQMEYEAKQYYPGFSRCIYLKGYRYNLHLRPRSVLLEVGAQPNTVEEVKNAMGPFSDILHKVLSGKSPASGGKIYLAFLSGISYHTI